MADKIINERPDQRIEHTHTVQMVEEHTLVLQEVIRELLMEMGPELSARFMELLADKLNKIKSPGEVSIRALGKKKMEFGKISDKVAAIDSEFEELASETKETIWQADR
jgi:3-deoxy-D-arabino-heptulosonate 7-phosphate (DAHP) synthase class II